MLVWNCKRNFLIDVGVIFFTLFIEENTREERSWNWNCLNVEMGCVCRAQNMMKVTSSNSDGGIHACA